MTLKPKTKKKIVINNKKELRRNLIRDSTKIGTIYLYFYKKLIEKYGKRDTEMSLDCILEVIHRCMFNVPRFYDAIVIEEMVSWGLLEEKGYRSYILKGKDANKFLRRLNDFFL